MGTLVPLCLDEIHVPDRNNSMQKQQYAETVVCRNNNMQECKNSGTKGEGCLDSERMTCAMPSNFERR